MRVAYVPSSSVFTCIGALGTPSRTGPSLESIHRVSLTVDFCEGNKIISLKNWFHHSLLGAPQKEKKSGALGTCPVCPLVKTALAPSRLPSYSIDSNRAVCTDRLLVFRVSGNSLRWFRAVCPLRVQYHIITIISQSAEEFIYGVAQGNLELM